MPNSLGFCGPDEGGKILEHLHEGSVSEQLVSELMKFEAAYPFIHMIAKSTGNDIFDYRVPEAYWIGNELLNQVEMKDFYAFSHSTLKGRDKSVTREVFRTPQVRVIPHHTLYVLMTLELPLVKGGPNLNNEDKLIEQMEACRVSWGKVKEVGKNELVVLKRPLVRREDVISTGEQVASKIKYDSNIDAFKAIKAGDYVSIHWNFACEKLSRAQVRNIEKYTLSDLVTMNTLTAKLRKTF
ncbi:MAG: hypothetical protein JRN68_04000 [Nitrososphaerota archaeon]|jgi:hydrogenase maturation factor|nr:hypothetical protein [Nitrososphaerota archaeon]